METLTKAKEICPSAAQKRIAKGAILVDVRERDETEALAYNAPNLLYIPLSEFEQRYHEIPKDKKIIAACEGGVRSLKAAYYLLNHGYDRENVVNMQHGIIRWVQHGFPTKGDTISILSAQGDCRSKTNCC